MPLSIGKRFLTRRGVILISQLSLFGDAYLGIDLHSGFVYSFRPNGMPIGKAPKLLKECV